MKYSIVVLSAVYVSLVVLGWSANTASAQPSPMVSSSTASSAVSSSSASSASASSSMEPFDGVDGMMSTPRSSASCTTSGFSLVVVTLASLLFAAIQ